MRSSRLEYLEWRRASDARLAHAYEVIARRFADLDRSTDRSAGSWRAHADATLAKVYHELDQQGPRRNTS